jgi:hypothetical protein
MNTPARTRREPVPELLDLVRALARRDADRDYARLRRGDGARLATD